MSGNTTPASGQDMVREALDVRSREKLEAIIAEYVQRQQRQQRDYERTYPTFPPNSACNTAVVSGLLLSNAAGFEPGNRYRYFACRAEKVYVWTHTANKYSALLVRADPSITKSGKVWKTLATILEIAAAFSYAFEHVQPYRYHWVYRFRPVTPFDDLQFYREFDAVESRSGSIQNLWFLAELAPLIDLLDRDDTFFAAAQQYYSSITGHWFCLQCELGPPQNIHHPSHEPEDWEKIALMPQLGNGLLQAIRAIESLVGQPGRSASRTLSRWRAAVDVDPAAKFKRAGKSYVDSVRDAYGQRNKAAHGITKSAFSATRRSVITTQCLAWELLVSYARKHTRPLKIAQRALQFNRSLLRRDLMPEYTTKMTEPKYHAATMKRAAKSVQPKSSPCAR